MFIVGLVLAFLFCALSWMNFRWSVLLLVVLLPAYLWRFDFGPLPTTCLELIFGAVTLVWLVKYFRKDIFEIISFFKKHKLFLLFFLLFFISSVISIFVSDMVVKSLGQWRAYFLEPMILFLILIARKEEITSKDLVWALIFSSVSVVLYSILQKFTGWGIATVEWTMPETRRVTAFFTSPNAVGLYLGPIFLLMAGILLDKINLQSGVKKVLDVLDPYFKKDNNHYLLPLLMIFIILSAAAVYFTKSQGAWIGMAVGLAVFFYLTGYKKFTTWLIVGGIAVMVLVPSMRAAVTFQKKSDQNRLKLWSYSWDYLKASPKNFVFGTGIRQFFRKIQKPVYNDKEMERLIYPHNIFLNFWTETGLFGMISFAGLFFIAFWQALLVLGKNKIFGAALVGALCVILVHGMVDVPYFKNDLAMYFWILLAIIFSYEKNIRAS